MKLTFEDDRVLAVMAHPDDMELLCAGTLARAKADGAAVGVCVMCTGEKGVPSGPAFGDLAEARRGEAQAAAAELGAELFWYGAPDGELFDSYPQRKRLLQIYRRFRPTLVLAHAPEDYHPDHRAASVFAEAATWFAASRGHVTEDAPIDAPPALWWCDTVNMSGFAPEFYVDITAHVELKNRMLGRHASQLQRGADGNFQPLMELMLRQCQARGGQADVAAAEAFRAHHAFKRVRAW